MTKEPLTFINHILESISLIEKYILNITKENFFQDIQLQDSIIRRIEIIGEALKNIGQEVKDKYPDIPWKRIVGMRDILIHKYFGIDLLLTWNAVKEEIPKLKESLSKIKYDLEQNNYIKK